MTPKTKTGLMEFRLGDIVEVCRDAEEDWCKGTINGVGKLKGLHVLYEDGDKGWVSWDRQVLQMRRSARKKMTTNKSTSNACDIDGCSYAANRADTLKRHQALVHDFGVTWRECEEKGCSYKAKHASHLRHHLRNIHQLRSQRVKVNDAARRDAATSRSKESC